MAELKGRGVPERLKLAQSAAARSAAGRAEIPAISASVSCPADARAAFQQGNVDARAIWDPYYSAALLQGGMVLKMGATEANRFVLSCRPSLCRKNGAFIEGCWRPAEKRADALTSAIASKSIALLAKTMGPYPKR